MALIELSGSVGKGGQNIPVDVAKISAALVMVGPDRGGIFAPPLSTDGLAQAIQSFQRFQHLPVADGKVDRGGSTLRRLNEILNPGLTPPPAPAPAGTGEIRRLEHLSLPAGTEGTAYTPIEQSFTSELVFSWGSVSAKGRILYFELDERVVPRWFGVLVPEQPVFEKAHIFFHPTPRQAGHDDANYHSLGSFQNIFHYLWELMGKQFCAAGNGRVLIMPLMTQGAAGDCGMFPQRWESIVARIFGMVSSGDMSASASPVSIASVVVSSFSSGITYSHHFRSRAKLGNRLTAVIDFDGSFSTFSQFSAVIGHQRAIRMQQMQATQPMLPRLAAQNIFPLAKPRWGGPFANHFSQNEKRAAGEIHGTIPQTMMFFAATRAG